MANSSQERPLTTNRGREFHVCFACVPTTELFGRTCELSGRSACGSNRASTSLAREHCGGRLLGHSLRIVLLLLHKQSANCHRWRVFNDSVDGIRGLLTVEVAFSWLTSRVIQRAIT